jgi:hypothetical protein
LFCQCNLHHICRKLRNYNGKFTSELQWRGLVHDAMPGTEEQLVKESTTVYIGFDPAKRFVAYW